MARLHVRAFSAVFTAVALAVAAQPAVAGLVTHPLGNSGWQVSYDDEFITVITDNEDPLGDGFVVVEIAKEFVFGPDPDTGVFPGLTIVFRQTDAEAVDRIAIDEEIIINSTGVAWTDFHWAVLNHGDVLFDTQASADFDVTPFTSKTFSPDATELAADGGVVPPDGFFHPGRDNGVLWIEANVATGEPFTTFTLKEFPTPEPATWLCLLGGMALLRPLRRATRAGA